MCILMRQTRRLGRRGKGVCVPLRHQLRGQRAQLSMIEGSIWRSMLAFAVPIFLGNLFQQLYNAADTLIVGNFIGKEALAAVSSSGNLIFMLAGAVMTVVGVALTPQILRWMGTPENVLPNSIAYFRTYFYGSIANFLYNISTGILQAVGDSKRPLYYLIVSSLVNVGLDLLFVAVLGYGVASAAAATVISQAVSALLCMIRLVRTDDVYHVDLRKLRLDGGTLKLMVKFGLPSGVQNSVIGFANVVVQANINAFGDNAMAGCGSYTKVEGFAFLPVTCFTMALSTFVSQNLGAEQYDRVKRGAKFGIACSVTMAEAVAIWLLAPWLIGLFNNDPAVVAYGVRQARVISLFYCLLALNHCIAGVLRGAGKAMVPMLVMLACWCVLRVSYITVAVKIWNDILVVFTAYPLTWTCSAILFLIYFFRVDWLHGLDNVK